MLRCLHSTNVTMVDAEARKSCYFVHQAVCNIFFQ